MPTQADLAAVGAEFRATADWCAQQWPNIAVELRAVAGGLEEPHHRPGGMNRPEGGPGR